MASFRILKSPICSRSFHQRVFRTQSHGNFANAIPGVQIHVSARRGLLTAATAPKPTVNITLTTGRKPHFHTSYSATSLPLRSPRFNTHPSHRPPFQSRRLLHDDSATPTRPYWERRPATLPRLMVAVCVSLTAWGLWAVNQEEHHDNGAPFKFIRENFVSSLTNMREGRWWTLLTPTVMHLHPVHLIANMLCLGSIGPVFVSFFGVPTFVVLWVGAGVVASTTSLLHDYFKEKDESAATTIDTTTPAPTSPQSETIGLGSSGSLFGMVSFIACADPLFDLGVLMLPIALPAWQLVGGFAVLSASAIAFDWAPYIGHDAHLGGMAAGVLGFVAWTLKRKGVRGLVGVNLFR